MVTSFYEKLPKPGAFFVLNRTRHGCCTVIARQAGAEGIASGFLIMDRRSERRWMGKLKDVAYDQSCFVSIPDAVSRRFRMGILEYRGDVLRPAIRSLCQGFSRGGVFCPSGSRRYLRSSGRGIVSQWKSAGSVCGRRNFRRIRAWSVCCGRHCPLR